jgi:hypothetical protein
MKKETPREELIEMLKEAQSLGKPSVVAAIREEIDFRDKVPSPDKRHMIREAMRAGGLSSINQAMSIVDAICKDQK